MKKILWAEIYSKILDESKFDIVVMVEKRIHVGPLFFELDGDEVIKETFNFIEMSDETTSKQFIDTIVNFYLFNKDNPSKDAEETLRHWFKMNGVDVDTSKTKYLKRVKIGHRIFRYNLEKNVLEYISERGHIIRSVSLSHEDAHTNLRYYCNKFNDEIQEELIRAIAAINQGNKK